MIVGKYLLYQGKKIFYRSGGTGNPVVLIHGFGEDGDVWKNQIALLPINFMLIIPDLPGSGQSEMIEDMSIAGMAEVIKSMIDAEFPSVAHEGGFKGAVIGHSMGGYIALAFAQQYPGYLNALGLFHSTAYADSEEKKAVRRKGIEFMRQYGAFEFLKTGIPNLFSPFSKNEMPAMIHEFIAGQNNFSTEALVSYYEAMMQRPDRTDVLKKARFPVLFIMGKYDNAAPMDDVLQQCHLPEKAYIHILEKSGHMGMLEEPDKSNRVLEKFLLDL
jgi:pimeloyl-ACP methyl ester carboxylesterase